MMWTDQQRSDEHKMLLALAAGRKRLADMAEVARIPKQRAALALSRLRRFGKAHYVKGYGWAMRPPAQWKRTIRA